MGYQEFKKVLISAVDERLKGIKPEVHMVLQQVKKNNNVRMDALKVERASNIVPMVYLELLYEDYKEGRSLEELTSFIAGVFVDGLPEQFNHEKLLEWEEVKNRVVLQVIGRENNQELQQNIPCRVMEDMLLTYRVMVDVTDTGIASAQITNMLQQIYGVTEDLLYQMAMKNSPELLPIEIKGMTQVVMEMSEVDIENPVSFEEMLQVEREGNGMYVLTNTLRTYGASTMFYPGVMNTIANTYNRDLLVLPSSIHECIILPLDPQTDTEEMIEWFNGFVGYVNETQVLPEEWLTNQVYVWDKEVKLLMIADKWLAHESEKDSQVKL